MFADIRQFWEMNEDSSCISQKLAAHVQSLTHAPLTAEDLKVQGLTNTPDCTDGVLADAAGAVIINYGGVEIQNCGSVVKNDTWPKSKADGAPTGAALGPSYPPPRMQSAASYSGPTNHGRTLKYAFSMRE